MRKIALTSAAAVLALGIAGITMAASPAPSATPGATPSPSPSTPAASPSAAPSPSAKPATTSSTPMTWSAVVTPLNVTTGTATVMQNENGTGTVTVTLKGLRPDALWTVDIDAGTAALPRETASSDIAYRSGTGVEKVSNDTVRIHLTATEMKDFLAARSGPGVVVLVSDGTNRSVATFPHA